MNGFSIRFVHLKENEDMLEGHKKKRVFFILWELFFFMSFKIVGYFFELGYYFNHFNQKILYYYNIRFSYQITTIVRNIFVNIMRRKKKINLWKLLVIDRYLRKDEHQGLVV